ncbi:MAG: PepSY-associated TM helix domain-containing protein [Dongiaceae bacterium]
MIGLLHLWLGLILCLPLVLIGLTGSLLVFDDEIGAVTGATPRAATHGERQPVLAMLEAAQGLVPAGSRAGSVTLPQKPGDPALIRFMPPKGNVGGGFGGTQILIDPITLAPLDIRKAGGGFMFLIHRLHGNLLLPGAMGRSLVGWLGVVMLMLGASGIFIWWPRKGRWRDAFTVKWRARPLRFNRDLHGAVGIWGLAVFMTVSFSGVYLVFPQSLNAAIRILLPARDFRSEDAALKAKPLPGIDPLGVDEAVALAQASLPGAEPRSIALPSRPEQPYRITLAQPGRSEGGPLATIYIDPWSHTVLAKRNPNEFSAGETVMAWQRPLHAGAGLGPIWQILVFLSGLLPLLFSITGITFWWLKRRNRRNGAKGEGMMTG